MSAEKLGGFYQTNGNGHNYQKGALNGQNQVVRPAPENKFRSYLLNMVMGLMIVVPQWLAYYLAIAAVLNAGGAIGDLWSVGVLLRYPAQVLVRDEADRFRIYALGADGSSTQNSAPPPGA